MLSYRFVIFNARYLSAFFQCPGSSGSHIVVGLPVCASAIGATETTGQRSFPNDAIAPRFSSWHDFNKLPNGSTVRVGNGLGFQAACCCPLWLLQSCVHSGRKFERRNCGSLGAVVVRAPNALGSMCRLGRPQSSSGPSARWCPGAAAAACWRGASLTSSPSSCRGDGRHRSARYIAPEYISRHQLLPFQFFAYHQVGTTAESSRNQASSGSRGCWLA